jgi:hypothetical protein
MPHDHGLPPLSHIDPVCPHQAGREYLKEAKAASALLGAIDAVIALLKRVNRRYQDIVSYGRGVGEQAACVWVPPKGTTSCPVRDRGWRADLCRVGPTSSHVVSPCTDASDAVLCAQLSAGLASPAVYLFCICPVCRSLGRA